MSDPNKWSLSSPLPWYADTSIIKDRSRCGKNWKVKLKAGDSKYENLEETNQEIQLGPSVSFLFVKTDIAYILVNADKWLQRKAMANVIYDIISNSFIQKLNFHQAFCGFVWRFIESVQIKIQVPNVRKCDKVASPRCCVWGRECSWAKSLAGHLSGSIYTDVTQCHKLLSAISKLGSFPALPECMILCLSSIVQNMQIKTAP